MAEGVKWGGKPVAPSALAKALQIRLVPSASRRQALAFAGRVKLGSQGTDTRISNPGPGSGQLPATDNLLASESQRVTGPCDTGAPAADQDSQLKPGVGGSSPKYQPGLTGFTRRPPGSQWEGLSRDLVANSLA